MTIAAYIRISDPDQNIDSQRDAIEKWLINHGNDLGEVRWYADKHTGRNIKRPGFTKLHADILKGKVHTVVFWDFDRISRSLKDGINTLHQWCSSGVRVICITNQLDLSGTIGQIIASVMFGLAQIGLEGNKKAQKRGIEAAKKEGVYTGRKPGTTKATPARARQLKAQGLTVKEISTALGVSDRTVWRYLKAV